MTQTSCGPSPSRTVESWLPSGEKRGARCQPWPEVSWMAMVGAFVGWQGVLLTIFLGALLGTLIFLPLMLMGRKKLVPFGVFLALGGLATDLFGPAIFDWYGRYLGVGG